MNNKNVIVTGGAGFIGSILCKALQKNGYNPIIIDNLSTGFVELAKYGELIEADFGDYNKMLEVFHQFKPLGVFHIAAFKSVPESIKNPFKYYENNVAKTNLLLKAMVDCNIKYLVFSSSAAIFGEVSGDKMVEENHETKPINPYGKSKLMAEKIIEDFNICSSCLRYFNVSGADPELELGEMNKNASNIFAILSKACLENLEFNVFGDNYQTHDGSCIRDYIHVHDLAKAHILAFEKQLENNKSFKVNLGNGTGFSVKELVASFEKVSGKKIKTNIIKSREGDPACVVASNKKAKDYLNFKPEFIKIEDHISHQLNWNKKIS
jgi:UDP-glucose-4-epimerase GalE